MINVEVLKLLFRNLNWKSNENLIKVEKDRFDISGSSSNSLKVLNVRRPRLACIVFTIKCKLHYNVYCMVYSPGHGPTDYRTERNMQSSIQPPPLLAERPDGDDLRHCDGEMDCMGHSFQVTKGEWLVKPPSLMSGQQTDVDILPEQ